MPALHLTIGCIEGKVSPLGLHARASIILCVDTTFEVMNYFITVMALGGVLQTLVNVDLNGTCICIMDGIEGDPSAINPCGNCDISTVVYKVAIYNTQLHHSPISAKNLHNRNACGRRSNIKLSFELPNPSRVVVAFNSELSAGLGGAVWGEGIIGGIDPEIVDTVVIAEALGDGEVVGLLDFTGERNLGETGCWVIGRGKPKGRGATDEEEEKQQLA